MRLHVLGHNAQLLQSGEAFQAESVWAVVVYALVSVAVFLGALQRPVGGAEWQVGEEGLVAGFGTCASLSKVLEQVVRVKVRGEEALLGVSQVWLAWRRKG